MDRYIIYGDILNHLNRYSFSVKVEKTYLVDKIQKLSYEHFTPRDLKNKLACKVK